MSENTNTATKQTWLDKALTVVENVCNKLPDPVILFCWLFLFTAIIGTIATVAQHHKLKEKMERNLFAGSFHCVKI